jgi:putative DNA primase/helicase
MTEPIVIVASSKPELRLNIAMELMKHYKFVAMNNGDIYVYSKEDGIYSKYERCAERIIEEFTEKAMGSMATRYEKNEVIEHIRSRTGHGLDSDDEFWDATPKNFIAVNNGILDIENEKLLEPSPDYHLRNKIPVTFFSRDSKELDGKNLVDKFLNEILDRKEDVDAVYELFGYCLYRSYFINKFFLWVGDGSNGKTTLSNVFKSFLGEPNVVSMTLQTLCNNKFLIANLKGKLVNIYPDIPARSLYDTDKIRTLTGDDYISAEQKFKQFTSDFTNTAKMIFGCNKMPPSKDNTKAFRRRLAIWHFNKVFDKEHGNEDKRLKEKLTQPEELSVLLLNALDGLRRLIRNECFSNYAPDDEVWLDYLTSAEPVQAFVELCMEEDPDHPEAYVIKLNAAKACNLFLKKLHKPPIADNVFSRKLHVYAPCRDGHKFFDKEVSCFFGIKLKRTAFEKLDIALPEDYYWKPAEEKKVEDNSKQPGIQYFSNTKELFGKAVEDAKKGTEEGK